MRVISVSLKSLVRPSFEQKGRPAASTGFFASQSWSHLRDLRRALAASSMVMALVIAAPGEGWHPRPTFRRQDGSGLGHAEKRERHSLFVDVRHLSVAMLKSSRRHAARFPAYGKCRPSRGSSSTARPSDGQDFAAGSISFRWPLSSADQARVSFAFRVIVPWRQLDRTGYVPIRRFLLSWRRTHHSRPARRIW